MNDEANEVELDESLIVAEEPIAETLEPQPEEPEIPEKYQNKSPQELIKMHQDAERLIGKQGNEVGELRSVVNDILAAQAQPSPAPEPEEEVSFFDDPDKALETRLNKKLDNDPRLQKIEQTLEQNTRQAAAQALLAKHPDADALLKDPSFNEWIGKTQVRQQMFREAHNNFNADVADELFTLYKEKQAATAQTAQAAQANRKDAITGAATGSPKGSSESRGKPILSREAIVELKRTNPDKYFAMLPQLKQAYAEKRVR